MEKVGESTAPAAAPAVCAAEEDACDNNPFNLPSLAELEAAMCNPETSIVKKMANVFAIKKHGGSRAMNLLLESLNHDQGSVLFRHEATYVLGQLGCQDAGEPLLKILKDTSEHEMVRHEAAEALSALGYETSLPVLQEVAADESVPLTVRQTCELSVHSLLTKIEEKHAAEGTSPAPLTPSRAATSASSPADVPAAGEEGAVQAKNDEDLWWIREENAYRDRQFNTIDPSEPYPNCTEEDLPWLTAQLLNDEEKLWSRYRALITLRNLNSPTATAMLALVLSRDASSALLRHEIAFVLGQLRIPSSACDASACEAEKQRSEAEQDTLPAGAEPSEKTNKAPPRYRVIPDFLKEHLRVKHDESSAARAAFDALAQCLKDAKEHPMARHEAALALGSLGASPGASEAKGEEGDASIQDTIIRLLQLYSKDPDRIVSESCFVGLDSMQEELGLELGVC
ncbi:putative PBS lyase HEAT-like repeat domain-containing protein [Neospora caninum Liverpool]|uniref:PBS lyase HEAT-like repeat domain-containing protein, putative n=1 Tax=Neospora caninum (strain Liverpool) TaxID=572307 RepID=F0VC53_NEOCL|nr:putative PBS lyase HEAT-like repeat domain-containing protein [Neospora caninum Liverpool]CBZ51187.1 putative PBS lyase HEAT-like repeat domain-containing protein [Neospora caninum Liverpool]CEL68498.1 TPA: PBS lyase HEAT-like repeat domain-containing protein, putative [Neospora caninum Liverpool]|eukprot:XP_003881220.1 putative PBS lyase HEAT-like repeat domain-containing protein [Neospora caninum Liverpool]